MTFNGAIVLPVILINSLLVYRLISREKADWKKDIERAKRNWENRIVEGL